MMLGFCDLLRHPKSTAPGNRLVLSTFQRRIIQTIYGPSDEHGRRLAQTVFILLPRGSRKTTLGAILSLGHAIGPQQTPYGQVIAAAVDKKQAATSFNEAASIVRMDPYISDVVHISDSKKYLRHFKSKSRLEVISADADRQHGGTPNFALLDELHVWRGTALWDVIETGLSKVDDGLRVIITTAGARSNGICWDQYKYASDVAAGKIKDPSFVPILFEADRKAPWDDEKTWHAAMPGLKDGFPSIRALRKLVTAARHIPTSRQAFEQLYLNRWGDGSVAGFVDMEIYDEGSGPIDEKELEGLPCWIGVDMSKTEDLTGISVVWRHEDGSFTAKVWAFLPEVRAQERAANSDKPWREWVSQGHIIGTPEPVIPEDTVEAKIRELADRWSPQEILFDPHYATRIMGRLHGDGYPAIGVRPTRLMMSPMYSALRRAIIAKKFRHGGNPVLRHGIASAIPLVGDTGLVFLTKRKSDAIDPVVATAMALGRAADECGPLIDTIYSNPDFKPEDAFLEY